MRSKASSVHGRHFLRTLAVLGAVLVLMPFPSRADSRSWDWADGDCGGSAGGVLSDETVDVEPGSSVCVVPPSYQMSAELRFYVGVEIEGQYFPGTSANDLRCKTAASSSVLVHSTTQCTVESGRQAGRIDYSPVATSTWFVDHQAMGLNDGTTWANAFTDLTSALTAATAGDQIWIAEGAYKPGGASPTRSSTFTMKDGVKILGGFDGTETVRSQRDPSAHQVTLSGDIGTEGVATDNVYHVVHAQSRNNTAVLDGVTVTGGFANSTGLDARGGGLFAWFGWPTIIDVDFVDNYASFAGGGVYNSAAPITIFNSRFLGNRAGSSPALALGGGFYGDGNAEILVNCEFSGNHAAWQGGGAYWAAGSFGATLRNLTFAGNSSAGSTGGGMYITNNLQLQPGYSWTVANVVLWGNSPDQVVVVAGPSPTSIDDSLIQGGWAGGSNILTGDPLLVDADGDDNIVGTVDDDLRLQLTSPAVDAGNNAAVIDDQADLDRDGNSSEPTPLDADFNARFSDVSTKVDTGSGDPPIVDMGAYEAFDAVEADLSIDKDDGLPEAVPGAEIDYRIVVNNVGSVAVMGATVSDVFPSALENCSWTCDPDGGATCTAGPVAGTLLDTVDLPVGSELEYFAGCDVDAAASGSLANTASVTLPTGYIDTNPSDNSSTDTDTLLTLGACGAPDDRVLTGLDIYGSLLIEACDSITASDCRVYGALHLVAGSSAVIGEGFSVDGELVVENAMPSP